MKWSDRQPLRRLRRSLALPTVESGELAARIHAFQKDVVLPIKGFIALILCYYFYFSHWVTEAANSRDVAFQTISSMFVGYLVVNGLAAAGFLTARKLSINALQWTIFTLGLLDALLWASLCFLSGGFSSPLYWAFPGLIFYNAISIPLATPQIILNLAVCLLYLGAGWMDLNVAREDASRVSFGALTERGYPASPRRRPVSARTNLTTIQLVPSTNPPVASTRTSPPPRNYDEAIYADTPNEPLLLRMMILILMVACCYGLQALLEKQRLAEFETEEFNMRQSQLEAAGRLAAEIAHQIKNPLGIINAAAFSLQKTVGSKESSVLEQIEIIREEVSRADRIITELMGYAQLAEGRVEKIVVAEELDRVLLQVFPPGARYAIEVRKHYTPVLPPLMMQRAHFAEIVANLLQNAREAMNGVGIVSVSTRNVGNYSVEIRIADSGPGISAELIPKVFEPYFTTKPKGTGLGLAIVKHNTEIYGGSVRVESELGNGAEFVIQLPAKALMRLK